MSLWVRDRRPAEKRHTTITTADQLIPSRVGAGGRVGSVSVTRDVALKHSAVWAACRLRADLVSTLPLDTFRKVLDIDVEVPKPPILLAPGGEEWSYLDWMWASQFDQDTCGNSVGIITERFANNKPARIELQPISVVSVRQNRNDKRHHWWIDGKRYEPEDIWHERAFPVPGFVLGLSPIAYAAWSIGEAMSMLEFATSWFGNGGVPKAHLKNTDRALRPGEAEIIQARHEATMRTGSVFVTGKDWEYDLVSAQNAGTEFIDGRALTLADIARYFGVPGDLIEATAKSGGSKITYANITQRNLQFLIMHLGPTIVRREWALSRLLPEPRFVKLNTDALLRMDPETREKVIRSKLESKQITLTEARALENRPAYTAAQEAEVEKWFGSAKATADAAAAAAKPEEPETPAGGDEEEEEE